MGTLGIILTVIGAILLILFIIGYFVKDKEEQKPEVPKTPEELAVESFHKQQLEKFEQLQEERPSVIRNSVVMWLVQGITGVTTLAGIIALIYVGIKGVENMTISFCWSGQEKLEIIYLDQPKVMMTLGVVTVLSMIISGLAGMARARNGYILKLEELIEEKDEVKKTGKGEGEVK